MLFSTLKGLRMESWAGAIAASSLLLCSAIASAQTWVPNEVLVSSQKDLLDIEFSQSRAQFCWSAADGKLWVGNVDRDTGMFYPPDGKGLLVDPDSVNAEDITTVLNGPEWVFAAGGDGIAYTKFAGTGRHNDRTARLAYARPIAGGLFTAGFLGPDLPRRAPYGSETPGDPKPRITYVDQDNNHYWREIDDPTTEHIIQGPKTTVGPVRNVRGARAVAYVADVDGTKQAFYRDLDTDVAVQLTADPGDKSEVWMWQAPEFGNEFVFMVQVGKNVLRIYRKPSGQSTWAPIYEAQPPKHYTFTSPEPFVFNGKSYVFMAVIQGKDSFTSEIWVSNIDAAAPIFKRISDNTVLRARTDPEVFITAHGAYVYYNRRTLGGSGQTPKPCRGVDCSEGIYRADSGL